MGNKGTNTTTQTSAPNASAMQAYQNLMQRASGVAGTPYNPYSGQLTAGVNPQQNLGIGNINTASQAGQPWFDYASTMAHPIGASDISNYQNPYTQNVVNATQAQFDRSNQQQQEGLKARAAAQGSLGGSRANIAAADMGYQQQLGQAPVIAGLYNNSYQQALAAAQQQQQAGFQGAGVGANIQQAGLQGAGAQVSAGTLEQQTEQQKLNALYQQYQLAQAFPYQQTQWLAGLDTGVGSQMGGTSTTTAPAPSLLSQVAGAGVAGVGAIGATGGFGPNGWLKTAFSKRGGRINGIGDYDAGGSVGSDPYGGVGFIPHMQIRAGAGAPHAPAAFQPPKSSFDPSKFAFPRSGVGTQPDQIAGEAAPLGGMSEADAMGVRGYDDGGPVEDWPDASVPSWLPDTVAGLQNGPSPYYQPRQSMPTLSARSAEDADVAPMPRANPLRDEDGAEGDPSDAYARGAPDQTAGVGPAPAKPGFDWSSLSMPLMAAGFGMMASRSPHPGVAIGEGALHGVGAYAEQQKETAARSLAEKKQALDARRLDQMAAQSRAHLALQTRTQKFHEEQANRPYEQMTLAEQAKLARERFSVLPGVTTADGHPVERDMQHSRQPLIDSITRKEVTPEQMQSVVTGGWKPFTDKVTDEGNPVLYDKSGNLKDAVTQMPIPKDAKLHSAKEIQISGQSLEVRAHQLALGDVKGAFAGLPFGSGANIAKQKIDEIARSKLIESGMSPQAAAEYMSAQSQAFSANGVGLNAEARTAGTREAGLKIILKAAEGAIPAALEASREVTRYSGFVPLDKIIQKGQMAVNDERMVKFGMANLQLAEHWARAMNPTGVMRESDRDMALKFLSTARNQQTYEAAVMQMKKQIDRELTAVTSVKQHGGAGAKLPGGDQAITRGEVDKEMGIGAAPKMTPERREEATKWLKDNPSHPKAADVRESLGAP